jgi:hypothetical protein
LGLEAKVERLAHADRADHAPVKGRMRTVEEHEVRRAVIAQPPGTAEYPFDYFSLI